MVATFSSLVSFGFSKAFASIITIRAASKPLSGLGCKVSTEAGEYMMVRRMLAFLILSVWLSLIPQVLGSRFLLSNHALEEFPITISSMFQDLPYTRHTKSFNSLT